MNLIPMNGTQNTAQTLESLERIYETITSEYFLSQRGLWNEIPFYVYDYPAEDELFVRNHVATILKKIHKNKPAIKIVEVDLYEAMLSIINDKWLLQKIIDSEKDRWSDYLEKAIRPIIKAENFNEHIRKIVQWVDIIFLTGVGKIYPLVRSHTILNNLHHVIPGINIVMFFPGEYTQRELRLFSKLKDDNYYRAFKLNHSI